MVSGTTKTKIITTASKNTGTQKKSKRANEDPKVSRLKQNASSTGKMRLTHWFNLVRVCWTNRKVLFVRDWGRSKVRFFCWQICECECKQAYPLSSRILYWGVGRNRLYLKTWELWHARETTLSLPLKAFPSQWSKIEHSTLALPNKLLFLHPVQNFRPDSILNAIKA